MEIPNCYPRILLLQPQVRVLSPSVDEVDSVNRVLLLVFILRAAVDFVVHRNPNIKETALIKT